MVSIRQLINQFGDYRRRSQLRNTPNSNHSPEDLLFKDCFTSFLKSLDGATRSRSYANDLAIASHIIDGLGNYRMSEINKVIIKQFINGFTKRTYTTGKGKKQKTQYYSQSTINKVYNLLHCFIQEAASEDGNNLLKIDYMQNIKKPRSNRPQKDDIKPLSDEEIKMLSDIVNENQMIDVWLHLMLYTGMRPSEPLALKFADIHYEEKTIDIFRTLSHEEFLDPVTQKRIKPSKPMITDLKNERNDGKANYQRRTIRVGNKLLDILKEWEKTVTSDIRLRKMKEKYHTEDFLFCGSRGQLWLYEDYKQVYERLLRKHGLSASEYNPYRFRHNCCTRLLRLGVNLKAVQLIMGDNTSDMVMKVYANLDNSDVLKGSQTFADAMDETLDVLPSDK